MVPDPVWTDSVNVNPVMHAFEWGGRRHVFDPETLRVEAKAGLVPPRPALVAQTAPRTIAIDTLELTLTTACNFRCAYCYSRSGETGSETVTEMSSAIGEQAIDWLMDSLQAASRLGGTLIFSGGEPLLRFELVQHLTEYAQIKAKTRGLGLALLLSTSGTLLSNARRAWLEAHGFIVRVNLDAHLRSVHDALRPEKRGTSLVGTFDRLSELVRGPGFRPQVIKYVVTRNNLELARFVEWIDQDDEQLIAFDPVMTNDPSLALTMAEVPIVRAELTRMVDYYRCKLERVPDLKVVNTVNLSKRLALLLAGRRASRYCGAGATWASIDPEGGISPCPVRSHRCGNVGEGFSAFDPGRMTAFLSEVSVGRPECETCWARSLCGGGCFGNAVIEMGRPDRINPTWCELERAQAEAAIALAGFVGERWPDWFEYREIGRSG